MTPEQRIERNKVMVARVLAGETLQAVGETYGITREYVRQLTVKAGIGSNRKRRNALNRAARRVISEQRLALMKAENIRCAVCDGLVLRRFKGAKLLTCGRRCAVKLRTSGKYRWAKSSEYRKMHKISMAKWTLAHRKHSSVNLGRIRWACRLLGKPQPPPKYPKCAVAAQAGWIIRKAKMEAK